MCRPNIRVKKHKGSTVHWWQCSLLPILSSLVWGSIEFVYTANTLQGTLPGQVKQTAQNLKRLVFNEDKFDKSWTLWNELKQRNTHTNSHDALKMGKYCNKNICQIFPSL